MKKAYQVENSLDINEKGDPKFAGNSGEHTNGFKLHHRVANHDRQRTDSSNLY